jgi:hypothetical protein
MIYKGSVRGPYVRFVRAPPSNGIGLIRSFCARWIAAFTPNLHADGKAEHNAGKVEKKVGQIEKVFEK